MNRASIISALTTAPDFNNPWGGSHKIPWNDPEFSRRMLKEHLTQDHDLASRRRETIALQSTWIHDHTSAGSSCRLLDLGCGPGLYASHFAGRGHIYHGIDFGPASIEYANSNYARPNQVEFRLGDLRYADFGSGYDVVLMLYGEINVFSPEDCLCILSKAFDSLSPGGRIVVEAHTRDAVFASGQGQSWYAAEGGLFTERPYICLTQNHWIENLNVAQQVFQVVEPESGSLATYRSTMQAYTNEEYMNVLTQVGFSDVALHADWPGNPEQHLLLTGVKA